MHGNLSRATKSLMKSGTLEMNSLHADAERGNGMQLSIETAADGGVIVTITGSLTANTVADLKAIWAGGTGSWIYYIVLHDTDFIDSMGLAALVQGLKLARQNDGELYLVSPSPSVRNLLQITAMDSVFPVRSQVPGSDSGRA